MPRKRILIFSTAYLPFVGGAEVAVKEITDRLGDNFDFVMITARLDAKVPRIEKIGTVEVHRVGSGNRFDKFWLVIAGASYAAKLGHFDAVWSIMASYAGFAALTYKKTHSQTPYLLTLQEGDSKWHIYKHVWWCWLYFKQIFTRADRIQAISTYLATWAKEMGAKCPIAIVPNGIDQNNFRSSLFMTEDAKNVFLENEFGIKNTGPLILTASRLVKKNGVDYLISALKFLDPKYHLLIAGSGDLEDELKQQAERMGLKNRIHFLGFVSHDRLRYLYAASTVFCRSPRSEGLGNVFLEAFGTHLPVVATDVGGIPDIVKDGITGLLTKPNDPEDLAIKIRKIVEDESLRKNLVQNASKFVQQFQWDSIVYQMGEVFKKMML